MQGHDISRIVLPILARYGYVTKTDPCFLQCFEFPEVKRLREELGWRGRLVMLIEGKSKGDDGTDHDWLSTAAGIKTLAGIVDGIGPAIGRIATWTPEAPEPKLTELVAWAHAEKLVVHPYTLRIDDLPKNSPSPDAVHDMLFRVARVDGLFSDFSDVTLAWLARHGSAGR